MIAIRLTVLAALLLASLSAAADPMLEARVSKLERMLSEQRLSDLVLQIQQLQQEVQDLRGMVENQQFMLRRQGRGSQPDQFGSDPSGFAPGAGEPPFPQDAMQPSADPFSRPSDPGYGPPGLTAEPTGTRTEFGSSAGMLPALPSPETMAGGEREAYRAAFEHLKARDYDAARVAFEDLLKHFPRGDFADNSRYWLGEINYQNKDYPAARAAFEQLIQQFPSSPKVPGAMLKLGYLACDEQNVDQGRVILQTVVRRFPDSAEGRLAAKRLSEINQSSSAEGNVPPGPGMPPAPGNPAWNSQFRN